MPHLETRLNAETGTVHIVQLIDGFRDSYYRVLWAQLAESTAARNTAVEQRELQAVPEVHSGTHRHILTHVSCVQSMKPKRVDGLRFDPSVVNTSAR